MWQNNFHCQFELDYQGLNMHLIATLPKLVGYLQETAIRHSEAVGLTMEYFFNEMTGWVILSWDIDIISSPKWLDKIKIYTSPAKFRGMFAQRGFVVTDINNTILLKASSQWLYTDRTTRKAIHLPSGMAERYGALTPLPVATHFKLPSSEGFEPFYSAQYIITRRDIDTNLHVNNISYLDWAMNSIPDAVYNNLNVKSANINYKKECNLGQSVVIKSFVKNTEFITNIYDTADNLLCEIYTAFA